MVETASFADNDLVAAAWADTLTRYHIPRHYALQLIDGVARDLLQSRYQTFDELATYCYGVASTVGLMSMYIVGFREQRSGSVCDQAWRCLADDQHPARCGGGLSAMDVSICHAKNSPFMAFRNQISPDGHITDNWRQFMKFQIERTRQFTRNLGRRENART